MRHDARGKLATITNRVISTETLSVIEEDPDDNRIVECAIAAKSDFIVSETRTCCGLDNSGTPGLSP